MNKVDLHIHSCHSDDGEWSVEQIIDDSVDRGMRAISITDHNSVAGVARALEYGLEKGLQVIPGIEIDCIHEGSGLNLHLLGYHIDCHDVAFQELENDILQQERWAGRERVASLNRLMDLNLSVEALQQFAAGGILTGESIGEYLLHHSDYNELDWLRPYRAGGSRSDMPYVNFYWDFFAQGAQAHVPMKFPSLEEAIHMIKKSGGLPVLAHPGKYIGRDSELLLDIMGEGVAGLEVFCSYHDLEISQIYYDLALSRGWLMSLGSDFHGRNKPLVQIGDCRCPIEDSCCFTGSLVLKYSC